MKKKSQSMMSNIASATWRLVASRRMIKVIVVPVVVLAIGSVAYWFMSLSSLDVTTLKRSAVKTVPIVRVIPIAEGSFVPTLKSFGKVESYQHSELGAEISSNVLSVLVQVGQSVKKGQALIQLVDKDVRIALKKAQLDVENVEIQQKTNEARYRKDQAVLSHEQSILVLQKKALTRMLTLAKADHVSEEQVDAAKRNYQQQLNAVQNRIHELTINRIEQNSLANQLAKANMSLEDAALDVTRATIRAPFNGVVSQLDASIGERVQQGQVVLSLIAPDAFELSVQVAPQYLAILKEALVRGQRISAIANVYDHVVDLTLVRVASHIDPNALAPKVIFAVTKGKTYLSLGQIVSLDISLPIKHNVFAVPKVAVYRDQIIYRITDNALEAIPIVRLGETMMTDKSRHLLVYSDTLAAGDIILYSRLVNPISGMAIKVRADNAEVDKPTPNIDER